MQVKENEDNEDIREAFRVFDRDDLGSTIVIHLESVLTKLIGFGLLSNICVCRRQVELG